jgi:hypothetical protein
VDSIGTGRSLTDGTLLSPPRPGVVALLPSSVLALSLLVPSLGLAQQPLERPCAAVAHGELLVPTVFEGIVLALDGSPAEGALVVSSAGGKAVTDRAGNFRLEVGVPLDAASLQLTAVARGARSLVASTSVALPGHPACLRVGTLLLSASSCAPSWLPTFGGQPGTNFHVEALVVFDDGNGPALYVGGSFTTAGAVAANHIARWDGASWSALGSGLDAAVEALSVFDVGNGPALVAAGHFRNAGGVSANRIARWDGASWSALGSGMNAAG